MKSKFKGELPSRGTEKPYPIISVLKWRGRYRVTLTVPPLDDPRRARAEAVLLQYATYLRDRKGHPPLGGTTQLTKNAVTLTAKGEIVFQDVDWLHEVLRGAWLFGVGFAQSLVREAFDLGEIKGRNELIEIINSSRNVDYEGTTRELEIAHRKIKLLKRRSKAPECHYLQDLADRTRKKTGVLNFSAIGRKLGVSYKTAQMWCRDCRVK